MKTNINNAIINDNTLAAQEYMMERVRQHAMEFPGYSYIVDVAEGLDGCVFTRAIATNENLHSELKINFQDGDVTYASKDGTEISGMIWW